MNVARLDYALHRDGSKITDDKLSARPNETLRRPPPDLSRISILFSSS
jgi:hypothetical protein